MFAFVKRTFLVLIGILLLAVVVWFAGPLFQFGSYRPLESATARLVFIALLVGGWLALRLVKRMRAAKATDQLLKGAMTAPEPQGLALPPDAAKLRERFEEAVATLKADGGQSLYELPWYVIIGAPGSGKTTALLNSGLKFPLEQRVGRGALRGVGGTRNCDWWFTSDAVFLDTAGRYTTQDSDASSDSAGWKEFLALLTKYRPRRPINGVILTISAQDLITLGPEAREAYVEAARRRLDELTHELGVQLPVYVMVTKCDLVAGFAEYFDDLTAEGRAQVWGVTFDYQQTLANEGPRLFTNEFDALITRLNERVLARVQETASPRRRARVLGFPLQMGALRDAVGGFVTEVFARRQFDGQILLRGVYFTSGTQEGTPFDRLLGSIARRFGAADAVAAPSGPGKAYFVEQLLKGVLIGESGLAGINRQLERRRALMQVGSFAAAGLVTAAGLALLSLSYSRNANFLAATATQVAAFEQVPPVSPAAPLDRIVPRLEAIRAIVDASDDYRQDTSWVARWGLYQGSAVGNAARDAYRRELDGILLPRVERLLRARLQQYASDPEKLYLYLKGYLMLGDPSHLDKQHLAMLADLEWTQATGPGSATGAALSKHFRSLLDQADSLRPLALDATVVAQARASIRQTSMPAIVYYGIKRSYSDESKPGPRLDQLVGLDAEKVFTRRSGTPISAPLPRLFTREAFKEITGDRADLVKYLANDAWVWGESTAGALASAGTLASSVTNLYELDYIKAWDGLLDDLQFAPFRTVSQTNDAFRILTASSSPLRGLLRVVGEQTTLVEQQGSSAPPAGVLDQAKRSLTDRFNQAVKPLQNAAGLPSVQPGTLVTAHFQWVRQLTAGEAGQAPIDNVIKSIAAIQQQLSTLGPDVAGADPVQILASPTFRALTQTLREQAASLPPGLRTIVGQIGRAAEGSVNADATSQIEQMYAQEILPACQRVVSGRYPFGPTSQPDVQLADFAELFGFGGRFDKFFTENLAGMVDASQSTWRWREGAVAASPKLLDQFQAALRIREMFFAPGTKTPKVDYFATLRDLDRDASRFVVDLDGQLIDDRHGAPVRRPLTWPGPVAGGSVVASFEARFYDDPKRFGGPWALFRLIDATAEGAPDAQQALTLRIADRYHSVRLTIEGARAGYNPFAWSGWRQFSCQP
ncbi:MAG: type VI secretion system membrane subunit TssM [Acidobacteria bacterium]|nr:type VI secretion system membrane subunit TssM [Acidobacteriota bacterium]